MNPFWMLAFVGVILLSNGHFFLGCVVLVGLYLIRESEKLDAQE